MLISKNKTITYISVFIFSLLAILGIYVITLKTPETESTNMYLERINLDGKLRYLVAKGIKGNIIAGPGSLREAITKHSAPEIFDHTFKPQGYADADLVVYMLNKWSDASKIPGAEVLQPMTGEVALLSQDIFSNTRNFVVNNPTSEREIVFLFYNLSGLKGCTIEELAKDAVQHFKVGYPDKSEDYFNSCLLKNK